jgi:hypothetical protein
MVWSLDRPTTHLFTTHPPLSTPINNQGRGTRRWRIQGALLGGKEEREGLIPNSPVRILANFKEDHAWVLQPGDMLYLPPRCVFLSFVVVVVVVVVVVRGEMNGKEALWGRRGMNRS